MIKNDKRMTSKRNSLLEVRDNNSFNLSAFSVKYTLNMSNILLGRSSNGLVLFLINANDSALIQGNWRSIWILVDSEYWLHKKSDSKKIKELSLQFEK